MFPLIPPQHEYLPSLQRAPLLASASAELVAEICSRAVPVQLHDGEDIYAAGDEASHVMLIVKGEAHVLEGTFRRRAARMWRPKWTARRRLGSPIEGLLSLQRSTKTTIAVAPACFPAFRCSYSVA